jgi:lysophospholipase L1-like esterase
MFGCYIILLKGAFSDMESRYYRLQYRLQRSLNLPYFSPAIVLLFLLLSLIAIFHQGYFCAAGNNGTLFQGGSFFSNDSVAPLPGEENGEALPGEDMFGEAMSSEALPGAGMDNKPEENPVMSPAAKAGYDFSRPVPAADTAVTKEYFEDAVFIGDSRTEGLKMFGGPQNAKYYASNGLKVDTVFTGPVVKTAAGEKMTVIEALRQTPFKKVYIMLGINELGWAYSDLFIEKYAEVIDEIKKIAPGAQIYVQSLLPVTAERSQSDEIFNNANIGGYNDLIQQMAAEKGLYYLNVAQCMADAEGNLFSDASTDGIHLKKAYCERWFDYLKLHYVAE